MRVAVIDCGTNTVRLYVAQTGATGQLEDRVRDLRFVRLGEGVDATGRFAPEALERLWVALDEFADVIHREQVDKVRFVATSAARDVSNRDEFFAGVEARLGVPAEVISGDEEAELSFLGALSGGELGPDAGDHVLVTDIGGGSTELILGNAAGVVLARVSVNIGSVRLRERYLHDDPPRPDQVDQARHFVGQTLDGCGVPLTRVSTWIGVAGTCTSLAGMSLGLSAYDRDLVHGSVITADRLRAMSDRLLTLSVSQTVAAYPSLPPMRAEVICAGALIVEQIAARVGSDLQVRDTDILDGAARRLVGS
ncbi:MAG: Ppx/GppA family phosphatase [Propionibacteriaceae bacterium]|jgi:exopolyphosphatase/guanosine-5'-triphosphate,3'-diphosphate pyrophosphatase|nr:Ppx/GppA family phosphatase [Propionibacteriaceae bacterium]